MRRIIIDIMTVSLTVSFIITGCAPREADTDGQQDSAAATAAAKRAQQTFVPPEDSAVTPRQFSRWKECGFLLDSLAYFYADSFKTTDPVEMLRIQDDFLKARDRICRRVGLLGHEEYKWVARHVGLEKNKGLVGE